MSNVKKVVLASSGGLDTSVILKWLHDKFFLKPRLARARQSVRRRGSPPAPTAAHPRPPAQRKAWAKAVNAGEVKLDDEDKERIACMRPRARRSRASPLRR